MFRCDIIDVIFHSRIDFCNCLFYDFPKYSIHRLQKIQNTVARILSNSSRFSYITPTLKSLHWLPIFYRNNFKICCITHRALFLDEPFSLSTLLTHRSNTHSLRCTSFSPILSPYFNEKFNGFRTFSYAAAFLWNHLLILFALRPLTCHLEKNSKLIYLIKLFLLRLSSQ